MALNSNIRNISLLGNCDLTNFHADIHDYDGFDKDNSLFLNKRKVNWWKRQAGSGEIGPIRGEVDGNYFKIYRVSDDAYLGKVKREYYNLETVEATSYLDDTTSKVVNPFPSGSNVGAYFNGTYIGTTNYTQIRKCGNYTFVWAGGGTVNIYDSDNELYDTIFVNQPDVYFSPDYVDFYYSSTGFSKTLTFNDSSWETVSITLSIPAGCVYVSARGGGTGYGYVYNPETKTTSHFVTLPSGWQFLSNDDAILYDATGRIRKSIDYGNQYCYWDIAIVDGQMYISFYNWFSGYSYAWCKAYKQGSQIYSVDGSGGYQNGAFNWYVRDKTATETPTASLQLVWNASETKWSQTVSLLSDAYIYTVRNYSKKYGPWAVNFIENTAVNIAHEYKKLYEIEGDESAGEVLSIDGYNDTYIYFHYAEKYYRISIAIADSIETITRSLNNVYYIFNTTSYLNAYYQPGDDWFCSCDDWNDRVLWSNFAIESSAEYSTSRLNNNWQNLHEVVSVSAQIAPNQKTLAVKASVVEAYSSATTWDGTSYVYDANGDLVDTSAWDTGHSLAGYYYATEKQTDPSKITPFYIDNDYTCPEYEDRNGNPVKQEYTVFFPVTVTGDTPQSLAKEGVLTADGFSVDVDEGVLFAIPDSSGEYQRNPALLDTTYLVYTTSVYILNNEGGYRAIVSSSLGGQWVLIFINSTEVDPLQEGDSIFCINGVEYTYRAETNRILDYNGLWVANTYMMKYIGFSTTCAYFYSEFDHAIYIFEGDNAFKKLVPLERYSPGLTVYEDVGKIDTLNITSLDVVIVNLTTACIVLFQSQYVLIETGTIYSWSIDESLGIFTINGVLYSLIKSNLSSNSENEAVHIPIEIETQFYGEPENETNSINDCVYLTVDNLASLATGEVSIQAIGLCNTEVIKAPAKTISLKAENFNSLGMCEIKYQPKLQECKGFKLKIKSDFEIAELKIGTSQGAMNQTTKRI